MIGKGCNYTERSKSLNFGIDGMYESFIGELAIHSAK
jgi:hypothetical protein